MGHNDLNLMAEFFLVESFVVECLPFAVQSLPVFAPKVVIVTMFEPAGVPGELALFRKRWALEEIKLSGLEWLPLFANPEKGILAVLAGVGTANAAVSIMALGMCEELDLGESHWLVSGIAGVNANRGTLGTVVWADWCIDGDLAYEMDAREIPESWSTGIIPLGAKEPYGQSDLTKGLFGRPYQVFQLNPDLVEFACQLTGSLKLQDTEEMRRYRAHYTGSLEALKSPCIVKGSVLSAARFWHGHRHHAWAEQWVKRWTQECGEFTVSSMEDTGTLHAIKTLEQARRADFDKVLLLRAASNFTTPAPGMSVLQSLVGDNAGDDAHYPGYLPALENACRAGSVIIENLIT